MVDFGRYTRLAASLLVVGGVYLGNNHPARSQNTNTEIDSEFSGREFIELDTEQLRQREQIIELPIDDPDTEVEESGLTAAEARRIERELNTVNTQRLESQLEESNAGVSSVDDRVTTAEEALEQSEGNRVTTAEEALEQPEGDRVTTADEFLDREDDLITPADEFIERDNDLITPVDEFIERDNNLIIPADEFVERELERRD